MNNFDQLKEITNLLDRRGLCKQADLVDKYLVHIAQTAPALPAADLTMEQIPSVLPSITPSTPDANIDQQKATQEKISRTTFLMLEELRDFFARNLNDFRYFGEENIKILQSGMDQLTMMYRVILRNITPEYNKEILEGYEAHLKSLQTEVDRSKKMKITPVKVKIDKFLLFNEFEILINKIERHYDGGLKELQPVLRKARAVRDAFGNIIQQTSEQIAHADLIETA